ncbi:MAG: hypothetical protein DRJ52_01955 [Thermoprotei archaeon]|nr:MAG: hypothetical protein DRJ52_01955 [Thermoprotei archaeon]
MTAIRPEEMVRFRIIVPSEHKDKLLSALINVGAVHLDPHAYRLELTIPELFQNILEKKVRAEEINLEEALKEAQKYLPKDDPLIVELARLSKEYINKLFLKKVIEVLNTLNIDPIVFRDKERAVVHKLYVGKLYETKEDLLKSLRAIINLVKIEDKTLLMITFKRSLFSEIDNKIKEIGFKEYELPEYCYTTSGRALEYIERELARIKNRAFDILIEIAHLIKSSIELEYATRLEILEKAYTVCTKISGEIDNAFKILRKTLSLELALRLISTKDFSILKNIGFSEHVLEKALDVIEKGLVSLGEEEKKIILSQLIGDTRLLKEKELKRLKDKYNVLKVLSVSMIIEKEISRKLPNVAEILGRKDLLDRLQKIKSSELTARSISLREGLIELSNLTEEAELYLNKLSEISSLVEKIGDATSPLEISATIKRIIEYLESFSATSEKLVSLEPFLRARIEAENLIGELRIFRQRGVIYATGWIPKKYSKLLENTVRSEVPRLLYFKVREPSREEKPPVSLKHKGLLKYFSSLTLARGIPDYWEIDPTVFFTVLFTIMYGLMFGDIGLGAVIAVFGAYLYITQREFLGMNKNQVKILGALMTGCGFSAVVFGVLYGIAFLKEVWHPIFLSPIHDLEEIMAVALIFGAIQLLLAMSLSVANKIISHDYIGAFLGGTGLAGIIYYLAGIYIAYSIVEHGFNLSVALSPPVLPATVVAVISIILVFISGVLKRKIEGEEEGIIHGFIELMEMIIAYPANSLSYIRLAAFAIAHEIFGVLAETMGHMMNPIVSLFFTNIIVLGIEGFAVSIQALRLVYYEFSMKFFKGEGMLYQPLATRKVLSS